jgi:demethylmenaquinone methyltransferase/2-methoxy-6-polyprenyl-1,4-benzoquinol methylase
MKTLGPPYWNALFPIRTMPDPVAVNSMFGRIARRYDIANLLLSFGIDRYWRWRLVRAVRRSQPTSVLDLATGSGDVAFALSRSLPAKTRIIGMDFCAPMLAQADAKKRAAGPDRHPHLSFQLGDGLALPLADASCDAITISFGLRNLADRHRGLREMHRVLRPGGHLFILEFSQPHAWLRPAYLFYLRRILPAIAGLVTGDRQAYVYLNESIELFPGRPELTREISAAGFTGIQASAFTGGIVALHSATR